MRPVFLLCFSLLSLIFCFATFSLGDDTLLLDLEITDDQDSYALNLGDFCMHDGMSVAVRVTNSTSKSMIFSVTPTCSCAKITESEFAIGKSDSKLLRFSIGRILAQQVVEFSLRLKDLDSNTVKVIGVKGQALQPVFVKEEAITVKSPVATNEVVTILSRFDRMRIESVEAIGEDYECTVNRLSPTESNVLVRPKRLWHSSTLVLNVKLTNGKEDFVFVPIVFEHKVNFITRELVFEKHNEGEECLARVIVQTVSDKESLKKWKIIALFDGNEVLDVRVVKIVERTKHILVLTLGVEHKELPEVEKFKVNFSSVSEQWEKTIPARIESKN